MDDDKRKKIRPFFSKIMQISSPISVRFLTISAPAFSFAYGLVMVKFVSPEQLFHLAANLAVGQLFGALPGLVLGFFHGAKYQQISLWIVVRDIVSILIPLLIMVRFLNYSDITLFIVIASLLSAYIDIFLKRFSPSTLIYGRGFQCIFWLILCITCFGSGSNFINLNLLLIGRIIGCLLPIVGLIRFLHTERHIFKVKNNASRVTIFQTLLWMIGSDSVFTIPILLMNEISVITFESGVIANLMQISQQLAGRITDYYTTLSRLNHNIKYLDKLLIGFAVVCMLVVIVFIKIPSFVLMLIFIIPIFFLVIIILVWSLEASRLTSLVLMQPCHLRIAAISGFFSMFVVILIFTICQFIQVDLIGIQFWMPALVGTCAYFFIGKRLRKLV